MSLVGFSSKGVIGRFYQRYEAFAAAAPTAPITVAIDSITGKEQLKWLGQIRGMRERLGGRSVQRLNTTGLTVLSKTYEDGFEFEVRDMRRAANSPGAQEQVLARIDDLSRAAASFPDELVYALMADGENQTAYDGKKFFATDHPGADQAGAAANQSNLISVDISATPVTIHGSTTEPSPAEFAYSVMQGIKAMLAVRNDKGRHVNRSAQHFGVYLPINMVPAASVALTAQMIDRGDNNQLTAFNSRLGFTIEAVQHVPELDADTDSFVICRHDGLGAKPFISVRETAPKLRVMAEGSEWEIQNDTHWYHVEEDIGAAVGWWEQAVKVNLT